MEAMDVETLPRMRPEIWEGDPWTMWHSEPRWPSLVGEGGGKNEAVDRGHSSKTQLKRELEREERRLLLSFLFFKKPEHVFSWLGRHKHRKSLQIRKGEDGMWSSAEGRQAPYSKAGGLMSRTQGNGRVVSLRSKKKYHMLRMVGRRWHPQIPLPTVTRLCGHCPPRVRDRFGPEWSLSLCKAPWLRGQPAILSSSVPASSWVTWPWEKDCPSTAGTTQAPRSTRSLVTQEWHLESNRWLPEWPGAILLLSWNDK